jgi:hypothetical protein
VIGNHGVLQCVGLDCNHSRVKTPLLIHSCMELLGQHIDGIVCRQDKEKAFEA